MFCSIIKLPLEYTTCHQKRNTCLFSTFSHEPYFNSDLNFTSSWKHSINLDLFKILYSWLWKKIKWKHELWIKAFSGFDSNWFYFIMWKKNICTNWHNQCPFVILELAPNIISLLAHLVLQENWLWIRAYLWHHLISLLMDTPGTNLLSESPFYYLSSKQETAVNVVERKRLVMLCMFPFYNAIGYCLNIINQAPPPPPNLSYTYLGLSWPNLSWHLVLFALLKHS